MTESFFRSYELDPDQPPKIKMKSVGSELIVEWDREDPELIAAGINDITPEEWSYITARAEEYFLAIQPIVEVRDDGAYWIEPGKEPVLMTEEQKKEKKKPREKKGFG